MKKSTFTENCCKCTKVEVLGYIFYSERQLGYDNTKINCRINRQEHI